MQNRRRELLTALGLLALSPGCASIGAGIAGGAPAAGFPSGSGGTFYDPRSGERLGRRRLLQRMTRKPIVLLGEVHDNADHHRIRAGLLLDWVHRRRERPAAVIFEHLDREHNDALRLAQKRGKRSSESGRAPAAGAGRPAVAELLEAARFDYQAWGWPAHLPLFEAARKSGATWIAANLSRASARRLSRHPDAEVDPALTAMVESARWSDQAQQALVSALLQGHCGALPPEAAPAVARVQRLRDAALALPLLDASERRSVLLAGNGHVRRDHGVPLYLGALEKEALVIGFEEVPGRDFARALGELVDRQRLQEFAAAYDCVCLTTRQRPEDPCAGLRPRPAVPVPGGAGPGTPQSSSADANSRALNASRSSTPSPTPMKYTGTGRSRRV